MAEVHKCLEANQRLTRLPAMCGKLQAFGGSRIVPAAPSRRQPDFSAFRIGIHQDHAGRDLARQMRCESKEEVRPRSEVDGRLGVLNSKYGRQD